MHEGKQYAYDDDDMEIYEVIDKTKEGGGIVPKVDGFPVGEWNYKKNEPEFYREMVLSDVDSD